MWGGVAVPVLQVRLNNLTKATVQAGDRAGINLGGVDLVIVVSYCCRKNYPETWRLIKAGNIYHLTVSECQGFGSS